ncbi:hypothetical protein [Bradyrhizobium sp. 8-10B]|uniref:hypothetical protein n=1 Tax=Bradyrhizobium sp. 8-10B TaxID=3344579 RepID=UPI0035BED127
MLDPRGRAVTVGAAGRKFYESRPSLLEYHDITASLGLMKGLLGVERLTFSTWVRLRPLFRSLLNDAASRDDMDLIACMVRQFVRLELGKMAEPDYESIATDCTDYSDPPLEVCAVGEAWWLDPSERRSWSWGMPGHRELMRLKEMFSPFEDAAHFDRVFTGMADRREAAITALRPIFALWLDLKRDLIEDACRYMGMLLSARFEETRLRQPEHRHAQTATASDHI